MRVIFAIAIIFGLSLGAQARDTLINIEENCHRISGKSWRVCGRVFVYTDGTVTSEIKTSSNRAQGFTGTLNITFYDKDGNAIYEMYSDAYGVNGYSSRIVSWKKQFDTDLIPHISSASVRGLHTPSGRWTDQLLEVGKKLIEGSSGGGIQDASGSVDFQPSQSRFGLKACNETTREIRVAVKYIESETLWVTEGWWHLDPDECKLMAYTPNRNFYLRAESLEDDAYWTGPDGEQESCYFENTHVFKWDGSQTCPAFKDFGKWIIETDAKVFRARLTGK